MTKSFESSIPRRESVQIAMLPIALIIGLIAVFAGLIASSANVLLVMLFVAIFAGIGLLTKPVTLLWLVLSGALVFSGSIALYYPPLGQLRWGVVIAALTLGAASIIIRLFAPTSRVSNPIPDDTKTILIWAAIFVLIVCFSTVLNIGLAFDTIIGLKGYFQVYSILLAFAWLRSRNLVPRRFSKALLWLAALQVPFALHQYFILVPQRVSQAAAQQLVVAPDIVVGTFIGSMGGGGGNVILSSLQIISVTLILSLLREKKIGAISSIIACTFFLIPVVLNETKVTFVILPLAIFLIYRDRVFKNPLRFVSGGVALVLLLVGLFSIYQSLPRAAGQKYTTASDYLERTIEYNFGSAGYGSSLLNRTTVYSHWASQHGYSDVVNVLIGHGAGETNEGGAGLRTSSIAITRYRGYGIGLTGVSALLWEVGIVGLFTVVGLFYAVFRTAGNLAQTVSAPYDRAILRTCQTGTVIMGFSLFHNNYFTFEIGYQSLLMLIFGIVVCYSRLSRENILFESR